MFIFCVQNYIWMYTQYILFQQDGGKKKWRNNQSVKRSQKVPSPTSKQWKKTKIKCNELQHQKIYQVLVPWRQKKNIQSVNRLNANQENETESWSGWHCEDTVCVFADGKIIHVPMRLVCVDKYSVRDIKNRWLRVLTTSSLAETLFSEMSGECLVGGGWRRGDQGAACTH